MDTVNLADFALRVECVQEVLSALWGRDGASPGVTLVSLSGRVKIRVCVDLDWDPKTAGWFAPAGTFDDMPLHIIKIRIGEEAAQCEAIAHEAAHALHWAALQCKHTPAPPWDMHKPYADREVEQLAHTVQTGWALARRGWGKREARAFRMCTVNHAVAVDHAKAFEVARMFQCVW